MIDGASVVQRLLSMMPGIETVSLLSRQAAEAAAVSSSWHARRSKAKLEEIAITGGDFSQIYRWFEFYRETQTVMPKYSDALTDAEGVTWQIKHVTDQMQGYVFRCLCLKNVT